MKKALLALSEFFCAFIFIASAVYANTDVNISGNTTGSNSKIEVHNTINSSSNTSSTTNSHTNVRIETNGQVKTYESDNPGNVNIQSDDGTAKVHINNSSNSQSIIPSTFLSPTPTLSAENQSTNSAKIKKEESENNISLYIIKRIENFLKNLFSEFHF